MIKPIIFKEFYNRYNAAFFVEHNFNSKSIYYFISTYFIY